MNATGYDYGFAAPASEIQPTFEETWNGFVAMMEAIDEIEEANGSVILTSYNSLIVLFVAGFVMLIQ